MTVYVYSLKSSKTNDDIITKIEEELKNIYPNLVNISYDNFFKMDLSSVNRVIFSGGDGTFNHMVNYLVNYPDITLGYIPTGTANDMAKVLKIKNYKDALIKIKNGNIKEYKLLEVKDNNETKYFNYALCFGNMASVSNDAKSSVKKKLKKFDYLLRGCKLLFCKREKIKVEINGKTYIRNLRALIIFRSKTLGGYRVTYRSSNIIRVCFINNIFDLGMMFILGLPIVKKCNMLHVEGDTISSIDGEKGTFKKCDIKISDKIIKIIA